MQASIAQRLGVLIQAMIKSRGGLDNLAKHPLLVNNVEFFVDARRSNSHVYFCDDMSVLIVHSILEPTGRRTGNFYVVESHPAMRTAIDMITTIDPAWLDEVFGMLESWMPPEGVNERMHGVSRDCFSSIPPGTCGRVLH